MEDKKDWVVSKIADYDDAFRGSNINIRKRITEGQLISAFKKIFKEEHDLKTKIELNKNIVTIGNKKYQYYVTTYTKRSHYPWYQISNNTINDLKEQNIDEVICVFLGQRITGGYPVYYKIWSVADIKNNWDPPKENQANSSETKSQEEKKESKENNKSTQATTQEDQNVKLRWNPEKNYLNPENTKHYMIKVKKGLVQ